MARILPHSIKKRLAASLFIPLLGCGVGQRVSFAQAPEPEGRRAWRVTGEWPQDAVRPPLIGEHAVVRLDKAALDALLKDAPAERVGRPGIVIALPMPDGKFARFQVVESSILSPALAAAAPDIRTYSGKGLDDTTATTRFGWTAAGFHAVVLHAGGSVYIDPVKPGNLETYIVYRKAP